MAEDIGHLAHLKHEGRLPRREIVRRAYARKHTVDNADHRAFCRNEGACLRHERDERGLTHVGALAGHVRSRYDGDAVTLAV